MMRPLRTARSISSIRLLAVVAGLLPTAACTEDASVSTTTVDFEVSEGTNLAFDISPDGETIVFDLLGQLWLLPAAGGAARPITDAVRDTAEDLDPVFSPDGRWIAFQTDRPGSLGLMVMPAEGGEPGTLTPDGWLPWGHVSPSWSPDGSELLLASWDSIYRLDMESRDMRSIPIELPAAAPPAVRLDGPAWAPDGASFAFGSDSAQEPWFRAFVSANARIWRVDVLGGEATPLGPDGQQAVGVEYAPDGRQVAYFAPDSVGRWQVWVRPVEGGEPVRVTDHDDVAYRRVRWTPQGESLIYSADGRLWRVASEGGSPDEIAFTARLTFQRHRPNLPPVRFPDPGTTRAARGFRGLALSHDGSRIGMLALGRLWVWSIGETPRSVTAVPITARDLSWSPDGTSVAYSDQALFVVDLETAATWQLTDLEGLSQGPVWSPDGEHIAFVYREEPTSPGGRASAQFRVVDANARGVTDMASTRDVGPAMDSRFFDAASVSWARDSTLLTYVTDDDRTTGIAMSLDGAFDTLPRFPSGPAYLSMPLKDTVVYVKGNRLWAARVDARAGMIGEPWVLSDDPALFPTAASSGAVLYVSGDGLRLRQPSGDTRTLGWPVRYDVPQAPGSLLIRNVRIIDGRDIPPTGLHDLLIEAGRIAAIDPSQESRMASAVDTLDGGGKTVIPGLIDLHQHLSAGAAQQAAGALYHGTTTVRDAGSALANTAALRDLIDSGGWPGPRVVFSGMVFHGGDWLGGMGNDVNQYVTDSAQIGRGVAVARAFGSDYVKYRGFHEWQGALHTVRLAHLHGMRVSGHCGSVLPVVAAGIDGQEHAGSCLRDRRSGVYDDYLSLKTASDSWVVPTAGVWLNFLLAWNEPGFFERPDIAPFLWEPRPVVYTADFRLLTGIVPLYEESNRWALRQTSRYNESGVRLATGTDNQLPNAIHGELEALVAAGLTPLEAIRAATSSAATVLGAEAEIGTIEVGKLADLVILDADPLEDIRNTRRIWQVIQGGRIVDREAMLEAAVALRTGTPQERTP